MASPNAVQPGPGGFERVGSRLRRNRERQKSEDEEESEAEDEES